MTTTYDAASDTVEHNGFVFRQESDVLWQVQSQSDPEKWYAIYATPELQKCGCKSFTKSKGKPCKHLKAFRDLMQTATASNGQPASLQADDSLYIPPEPAPEDIHPGDKAPDVTGQALPQAAAPKASPVRDMLQPWIIQITRTVKGVPVTKEAVKVAGLVHLAHQPEITGLKLLSLTVTPVHTSSIFAVMQATAVFQDDHMNRLEFSDIADATPENVADLWPRTLSAARLPELLAGCYGWP